MQNKNLKTEFMLARSYFLKMKSYKDSKLNPGKNNFFDKSGNNFKQTGAKKDILNNLDIRWELIQ